MGVVFDLRVVQGQVAVPSYQDEIEIRERCDIDTLSYVLPQGDSGY